MNTPTGRTTGAAPATYMVQLPVGINEAAITAAQSGWTIDPSGVEV